MQKNIVLHAMQTKYIHPSFSIDLVMQCWTNASTTGMWFWVSQIVEMEIDWLIEHGLTSPPTQYRLEVENKFIKVFATAALAYYMTSRMDG